MSSGSKPDSASDTGRAEAPPGSIKVQQPEGSVGSLRLTQSLSLRPCQRRPGGYMYVPTITHKRLIQLLFRRGVIGTILWTIGGALLTFELCMNFA